MTGTRSWNAVDPPTEEPVIELLDVRKVYASGSLEVAALRGIDLRVEQGAKTAQSAENTRASGRPRQRLQLFHQRLAGRNVDAGIAIAGADHGIVR